MVGALAGKGSSHLRGQGKFTLRSKTALESIILKHVINFKHLGCKFKANINFEEKINVQKNM